MDIDALHSALASLTLLPEELRSARDEIAMAGGDLPSGFGEFLNGMERDLRVAKAMLAIELGFKLCQCCWPPELLIAEHDGRMQCPVSAEGQFQNATAAVPEHAPVNPLLRLRHLAATRPSKAASRFSPSPQGRRATAISCA